jgi:hypothetical protein
MPINLTQAIKELCASAKPKRIEDTGKYDETKEAAIRDMATKIGAYAESGQTFDPEGKYLCGGCSMRDGQTACTHVSGKISMVIGSCFIYLRGEPMQAQVAQKLTQIEAMYSERPKSKGFGCSRCEYGAEAKKADGAGRPSWCSWWGMHIVPLACCFMEDGKDLVEAPGE